jgi:hypothetical protein
MATHKHPKPQDMVRWWADETGNVHICEGPVPLDNELLIWTLCDREVEASTSFVPSRHDEVTCSKCAAAEKILKQRAESARHHSALA